MKNLMEITIKELESVDLPEFDSSYFPQEHLIESIFNDLNLSYYKNTANTGTVYYNIAYKEDEFIKLRLGDHTKSNYLGREVNINIIYDDSMTESDLYNELYQELAWRL